jgi:hypothetical protein
VPAGADMCTWRGKQVPTGAWFPLALAAIVMAISCTWHWASIKRMGYHNEHAKQLPSLLQPVYNKSEDNDNGEGGSSDPSGYRVSDLHSRPKSA